MPKYTNHEDLIALLSDRELALLTSDNIENPEVVEEIVDAYLAAAESLVESAIGNRYKIPFETPIPAIIKMVILTIAKYRLFLRRGFVEDAILRDYEDQIEFLAMVRSGAYDIPVNETGREMEVRVGFGEMVDMEFFRNLFA